MSAAAAPGVLYIVATPIGNLEDLTHRAARVLGEVELIACEDTRHSRKLLDHYGIHRPLVSYYRENEATRGEELLRRLQAGDNVALVSDAGTPLLSDPGARLVARAVAAGIRVVPLPGASAPLAALMACGIWGEAGEPVAFLGFPPARAGARRTWLAPWRSWPGALVLFESPHRLPASLAALEEVLGPERPLVVARELTKLHEEFQRGTVASLAVLFQDRAQASPLRGECTMVVGPAPASAPPLAPAPPPPEMTRAQLKQWARAQGWSRSEAYRRLQQLRGTIKD
ncbi:MAG TPA: 16S rRNA (cytidine(1402)-2'-O)-methyltransferase [Terriglobales bacterium]|nr:16S rRNA (cytidine(1402)-2'-O)-methyltransferase [Terriglobales bacterium]